MVSLTDSQSVVAGLHYSDSQLVIAGPGTGKTTTAIELIKSIDSQLDFNEERSVLFLSFSRAAIQAAFDSMESEIEDLDLYVKHQTLDSLATSQLAEFGLLGEGSSFDFDSRIRKAIDLLKNHGEELLEDICHIIVDEAQDILGIRQQFLAEVISHLPDDCGISVFGDPYQTLYQFQVQKKAINEKKTDQPQSLVEWEVLVNRIFKNRDYSTTILQDQFRAQGLLAKKVFKDLEYVRETESQLTASSHLRSLVSDLNSFGLDELKALLPRWSGSVSLLTRTNADAIQIYEAMIEQEIPSTIVLRKELRPALPSWLGKWALEASGPSFNSRALRDFIASDETSMAEADALGIQFAFDDDVSWDEIRQAAQFYSPQPKIEAVSGSVLVTTVHQSKGLEFDNVLVHNPEQYVSDVDASSSALEVLFVALSRGKKQISSFQESMGKVSKKEGTWFLPHPNSRFTPKAICIDPRDIRIDLKVGDSTSQERLAAYASGDKLHFEVISSSFDVPIYRCFLDGLPVATTTEDFGRRLVKIARVKDIRWPKLSSVPVVDLESSFSKDTNQIAPFLIPLPLGFSEIKFK